MDAGADKEDGSNCEHESTRCTARGAARPQLQQHADSQYTQSVQSGTCAMHTGTGMHSRSTDGAMTGQSCYDSIMRNRAGVVYDKQLWSQARQGRGRCVWARLHACVSVCDMGEGLVQHKRRWGVTMLDCAVATCGTEGAQVCASVRRANSTCACDSCVLCVCCVRVVCVLCACYVRRCA